MVYVFAGKVGIKMYFLIAYTVVDLYYPVDLIICRICYFHIVLLIMMWQMKDYFKFRNIEVWFSVSNPISSLEHSFNSIVTF